MKLVDLLTPKGDKIIGNLHLSQKGNQILQSGISDRYKGQGLYSKLLGETVKARGSLSSGGEMSGPATSAWLRFKRNAPVDVSPRAEIKRLNPKHPFWVNRMKESGRKRGDVSGASTGSNEPVFSIKKPEGWTR